MIGKHIRITLNSIEEKTHTINGLSQTVWASLDFFLNFFDLFALLELVKLNVLVQEMNVEELF